MDDLNLSLPAAKPEGRGPLLPLVSVLLILVLVQLGLSLKGQTPKQDSGRLDALKATALKLEENNLGQAAAQAWESYLKEAGLPVEQEAAIRYRLAGLLQDQGHYEKALTQYYRCEATAQVEDLQAGINKGIEDCLTSLGQFTALRSELETRVGLAPKEGALVVAEIGKQPITLEDIDRKLEMAISLELDQLRGMLSEVDLARQKEIMWQRATTPQMRLEALQSHLMEEALYRKAMQSGRAENPELKQRLALLQKQFWAGEEFDRYLAEKIHISDQDLRAYFSANPDLFKNQDTGENLSYEQAQGEVFARLNNIRRQEAQQILFLDLKDEFDVVLYSERLQSGDQSSP